MKMFHGNLWSYIDTHRIVITTNIGWHPRTKRNNMGAGMALQAAQQHPELPEWYGRFCESTAPDTPVIAHGTHRLIFLPVKPLLDRDNPEISWAQKASLETIERGLPRLAQHEGPIALGFPGCGNGDLRPEQVLPLLKKYLPEDRFFLVDLQA